MPRLTPTLVAGLRRLRPGLTLASALLLLCAVPASARAAAFGWLRVTSITAGAKVQVDGRTVGHLPLKKAIRLRAGRHRLRVTKPGFMEVEETVVIRPRKRTTRAVMLLAFAGVLTVRSSPSGAEVRVGDEVLGKTPLEDAELVVGEQTVEVVLSGHQPWVKTFEVQAGTTYQFRAVLEADPAEGSDALAAADPGDFELVGLDAEDPGEPEDPFALVDLEGPTKGAPDETGSETEPEAPLAAVSPPPAAPVAAPSGEPRVRRPLTKQWWFWTAVGVLATGAIAAGAAGAPPRAVLDCSPVSGVDGHLGLSSCGG